MIDIQSLTIEKAHAALKEGEFTCRELAEAYRKVIAEKNKELNAYLEVFDDALVQADIAQKMFKEGKATMLTGIPFAIKDNILIEGKIASASSKILGNYKASYDSTVIKDLKKAGAVFLGRTNMDEFAMGSSTQTSAYGVTRNPIDPTRVPGGSSGGSAAALGGNLALASLGTETCGSVREPAAFCGLVGLKPTYGAVSRQGIIAMGNSLDQVSPFGKCVRDTEIIFNLLSRYDKEDSTSVSDDLRKPKKTGTSKKIGVPWHLFKEGVDPQIEGNFKQSLEKLTKVGYEIVDIELPFSKYSLAAYYIIMPAEVSTNLSRFDGVRFGLHKDGDTLLEDYKLSRGEGFGKEVRRRILLGTYVLSAGYYDAYYRRATAVRELIRKDFNKVFESGVDAILTPTTPSPAFKIGEKVNDPIQMYLSDIYTITGSLAGIPCMSVPCGATTQGLPVGMQILTKHFAEDTMFRLAHQYEVAGGFTA